MKQNIHLNRRGRLARTLLVLSISVTLGSVFGAQSGASTSAATSPTTFVTVTVAPGESLWSLASRLADGNDVRGLVDEIVSVNSLDSGDITAGQKIRVPLK
jgi:LysM repeat protein